jgi:pyruvate dehydrogenase E1 component alpha subunit
MTTAISTHGDTDTASVSREELEELLRIASTIKLCDERVQKEAKAGVLKAATYPVRGLEGVCAAIGVALETEDYIVSTYRNLGDVIAKGIPLVKVIAELAGRSTGVAGGKGGAMHMADTAVGFITTTGIVGSGLPIANGLALAAQMSADGRVTVVTFGDGATSIGAFHEALNLATLWKLPVVFVCQNNGWGEHTPIEEYMAQTDIAAKARSYGMEAETLDGFDAVATLAALRRATATARAGRGPYFVEAQTYRLSGHTSTADYSYMDAARLAAHTSNDAIVQLRARLTQLGAADAVERIESTAAATVDRAFTDALAGPEPAPSQARTEVYAAGTHAPEATR